MDQLSAAETNASPAVRRARWRRWALRVGVGLLLVIAAIYVLINFAIDMLYAVVDPRVKA